MGFLNREIVDVDLAPLLLELPELVRGEAAYDLVCVQGRDRDEVFGAEQTLEVLRPRGFLPYVSTSLNARPKVASSDRISARSAEDSGRIVKAGAGEVVTRAGG